jgi:hypothetical protein
MYITEFFKSWVVLLKVLHDCHLGILCIMDLKTKTPVESDVMIFIMKIIVQVERLLVV